MNFKNNRGSSLVVVLVVAGILSVLIYFMPSFLNQQRISSEDQIRLIQSKMFAQDILELGKYLLSYEKVVFLNDPLSTTESRLNAQKDLNTQTYGSLVAKNSFIVNACGGYDSLANEIGNLRVNNEKVFCPYYVRNPLMSGELFQNMMLKLWSSSAEVKVLKMDNGGMETEAGVREAIMKREQSKAYSVEFDLTNTLKTSTNQLFHLHVDQSFIQTVKGLNPKVTLRYTIYSPESGFEGRSSERYITLRAEVSYGNLFKQNTVVEDSIILSISTVKDFAIFLVYPEDANGNATKSSSLAMNLGGASSEVHGRVFFNGNIDTDLDALPTFNEVVVITGELISNKPYEQIRSLLAKKFKKGLIQRFPSEKLILDGECVAGHGMANQTQMFCKDPNNPGAAYSTAGYIQNLSNICSSYKVTATSGAFSYDTAATTNSLVKEYCQGSAPEKVFVSGGVMEVVASGSHVYIMSPVKKLTVGGGTNIYGTILGGHISATGNNKFYNFNSLKPGLPGIPDKAALGQISKEGNSILAGVGVPLINMPMVKRAYLGD